MSTVINFPSSRNTHPVRIKHIFFPKNNASKKLKFFTGKVAAGNPSLVEDYTEGDLNLHEHLIPNPEKSFIVRVSGDSMIDIGIHPDDLLIVDHSKEPANGSIVIAVVNGELTVKRLCKNASGIFLMPENPGYAGIEITEETHFHLWGVVTNVIHSLV